MLCPGQNAPASCSPTKCDGAQHEAEQWRVEMTEPALSIVGGGLAAAIVTILFNAWWDRRKDKRAEDWEFRRYRANLVHGGAFGLMEVFFSAKTEIDYLVGML